jgi:hypothetical protein
MNVDFPSDVKALVQQAIESGRLNGPEDAVQEALCYGRNVNGKSLAADRAILHPALWKKLVPLKRGRVVIPIRRRYRRKLSEGRISSGMLDERLCRYEHPASIRSAFTFLSRYGRAQCFRAHRQR